VRASSGRADAVDDAAAAELAAGASVDELDELLQPTRVTIATAATSPARVRDFRMLLLWSVGRHCLPTCGGLTTATLVDAKATGIGVCRRSGR
jgi:hypothetical protein